MSLWLSFWLKNINFILEMTMVTIALGAGYLHLDALRAHFNLSYLMRGLGFIFIIPILLLDALLIKNRIFVDLSSIMLVLGLVFFVISFYSQPSPKIPDNIKKSKVLAVLPFGLAKIADIVNLYTQPISLFFLILILPYMVYRLVSHIEKQFKPLLMAFVFILLSRYFDFGHSPGTYDIFWGLELLTRFVGFVFLGKYVYDYMRFRYREQIFFIYIGLSLMISTVVVVSFSFLLFNTLLRSQKNELLTNLKIFNVTIERSKSLLVTDAKLLAEDSTVKEAISSKNSSNISEVSRALTDKLSVDFVIITDADGVVLYRTHFPSNYGDNISNSQIFKNAVSKVISTDYGFIDETETNFALISSAPIYSEGKLLGVGMLGYLFDNTYVSDIKDQIGLEATIFAGPKRVATTISSGGSILAVNTREASPIVLEKVLNNRETFVTEVDILNRPSLAAYMPLIGIENKPVGMLQVSRLQSQIFNTFEDINTQSFTISLILTSILLMPFYLIFKRIIKKEAKIEL